MDGKIAVIKRLREAFGLGLLEAKRIADGEYKFTDYVNVNTFADQGMSLVPRQRLIDLERIEREARPTYRITESDLEEYFDIRTRSAKLQRQADRVTDKLYMVRETHRLVRNRILGQ